MSKFDQQFSGSVEALLLANRDVLAIDSNRDFPFISTAAIADPDAILPNVKQGKDKEEIDLALEEVHKKL